MGDAPRMRVMVPKSNFFFFPNLILKFEKVCSAQPAHTPQYYV